MYEVEYTLDLNHLSPADIIELHQQGILTMNEIIASGRMNSEFGDTLRNYVYERTSMKYARDTYSREKTLSSQTRMVTVADRKLRSAG